jgi:DNA-binding NtrC family response regulator
MQRRLEQPALRDRPDLVLLDIWMPDTDGVTLLKEWSSTGVLTMPVIMMSGHATIDTAVEATKIGAMAFLEKPITMQKLLKAVEQGLTGERSASGGNGSPHLRLRLLQVVDTGGDGPTPACRVLTELGPQSQPEFHAGQALTRARDEFEKAYFEYHLARENGSMTRVAEKTGLERTHLYRKLKQLGSRFDAR